MGGAFLLMGAPNSMDHIGFDGTTSGPNLRQLGAKLGERFHFLN